MAIRKLPNGRWQAQVIPNGRDGKRMRRQFATKGEAQSYEKFIKDQAQDKPWLGEKTDKLQIIKLVELGSTRMASRWRMARSDVPRWRSPAMQWEIHLLLNLTRKFSRLIVSSD
jgi:hypothetical protein